MHKRSNYAYCVPGNRFADGGRGQQFQVAVHNKNCREPLDTCLNYALRWVAPYCVTSRGTLVALVAQKFPTHFVLLGPSPKLIKRFASFIEFVFIFGFLKALERFVALSSIFGNSRLRFGFKP